MKTFLSPEAAERLVERVIKRELDVDTIVHFDGYHGEVRVDAVDLKTIAKVIGTARTAVQTLRIAGLLDPFNRYLVRGGALLDEAPPVVEWCGPEGLLVTKGE